MRNFKLKLMYLAVFALIFSSCSKDENTVNNDLESANKNMNGIIVISEEDNTDIFDIVEEGFEFATDLEIEN